MSTLTSTQEFCSSYADHANYPSNILDKTSLTLSLSDQKRLFDINAPSMLADEVFDGNEDVVLVRFRDWVESTGRFIKLNFRADSELQIHLENRNMPAIPQAPQNAVGQYGRDPRCRFIYLWSESSRAKLKLTRKMLTRIFSYHQVNPAYLDFISVFGLFADKDSRRFSGRALRFTGFRPLNPSCLQLSSLASHGRSGRSYALCYNMKRVAKDPGQKLWSIQQAAFYHQFDVENGDALWISTLSDHEELKRKVEELTHERLGSLEDRSYGNVLESFRSSLGVHLTYSRWSTGGWRWYVESLEDQIENISQDAIIEPRDGPMGREYLKAWVVQDLQEIQGVTDKANEAIMVMKGNLDVMARLCEFYESLLETRAFLNHACGQPGNVQFASNRENLREHVRIFVMQLHGLTSEMNMHVARAKLMVEISGDRNRMILQHLQGQATEKMQTMTSLSIKEAIVMRVITVVTLIFLPATFVSTFFSTDIVKYQNTDGNGSFSSLAMKRWLEVTISLTFMTLVIGYVVYRWSKKKSEKHLSLPMFELRAVKT